jgi:hypothetical protein
MTGAFVAIVVVLITIGGITLGVVGYFRLQRHRTDVVAMAGYRRLADRALSNQDMVFGELDRLAGRVAAVERLLRSVE